MKMSVGLTAIGCDGGCRKLTIQRCSCTISWWYDNVGLRNNG